MPSHVSGVEPNALDKRIAMSTEIPERSLTNSDRVCRVTPSPCAARVTVNPIGAKTVV